MDSPPLRGTRIISWGQAIAGPLGTKFLGLLGAEVICLESPSHPDMLRLGCFVNNSGEGQFWNKAGRFNNMNLTKKSLVLDISAPQGKEIFKRLISITDAFVENWTPRTKVKLGLTYSELKKLKTDIIMVSASGYGQTGPWANRRAVGFTLGPMAGLAYLTGYPGREPVSHSMPLADFIAGYYVALATVFALEYRRRTGKGQWVDFSEFEGQVLSSGQTLTDYCATGRVQSRRGNRDNAMAPHGVYRCKGNDNWIAIAVSSDREWQAMCTAMRSPSWAQKERFSNVLGRLQHQDELDRYIEAWTSNQDKYEVMQLLQNFGVPAGAVATLKENFFDPHLKARGYYVKVKHPDLPGLEGLGERIYGGLPYRLPGLEGIKVSPPPAFGQHNEHILRELLGLSSEEIRTLEKQKIIGNTPIGLEKVQTYSTAPLAAMLERGQLREVDVDFADQLGVGEKREGSCQ